MMARMVAQQRNMVTLRRKQVDVLVRRKHLTRFSTSSVPVGYNMARYHINLKNYRLNDVFCDLLFCQLIFK